MTLHSKNYNQAAAGEDKVVDDLGALDRSRRMSDLEETLSDKLTSKTQAQFKLDDLQTDKFFRSIKTLGAGVQAVGAALGPRSQKMMRLLSGIGQIATGSLEAIWKTSVDRDRTSSALQGAREAAEAIQRQLESLSGNPTNNGPTGIKGGPQ